MKTTKLLFLFFFSLNLLAQESDIKKISKDACICLDEVSLELDRVERYEEIESCIESAITSVQLMDKLLGAYEKMKDSIPVSNASVKIDSTVTPGNITITIVRDLDYKEVEEHLLRNCERMQRLMTSDSSVREYSVSDKEIALKFYNEGMDIYGKKEYKKAISKFKKAIKKDRNFAFAFDMVGMSYRLLENYKSAIKYYDKSLEIDPKGRMPLMNKPIAYALSNELENSIEGYLQFIEIYSDDPEGYYGIGRIYHLLGDYENAIDNTMKSYNMYNEIDSPYARDAEANLGLYYRELREKGQLEIFNELAKKHNIKVND
jgi:tetratricopeptide (TPR) repeat protein